MEAPDSKRIWGFFVLQQFKTIPEKSADLALIYSFLKLSTGLAKAATSDR